MTKHVLTIIQARMGSSRLPNKVLLPLGDKTVLAVIIDRIKKSQYAGEILVAATWDEDDDIIEKTCRDLGIKCFRGHPTDLLDRHFSAAVENSCDVVVKIPSDCPLIDHKTIDKVIGFYLAYPDRFDYVSNLHPATWPDGNDVEVMSVKALEKAWRDSSRDFEREHTTPFLWENPELFRIANIDRADKRDFSMSHRWTLDYKEDYELIKTIYNTLQPIKPDFTCDDILELLEQRPEFHKINHMYLGVNWYQHHLDDLKTIQSFQTRKLSHEA